MYSVVLMLSLAGGADATTCCWGIFGGCYGGCYGGGCYGGCYGGGCYGGGYYGGCYGGTAYGGYYGGQVYYGQPGTVYGPTGEKIGDPKKAKDPAMEPVPATLTVNLPANAKLMVDNYVCQQTSSQRVLQTPAIPPGQTFSYTLVAEVIQDGKAVCQTQQVTVRGGQQLPVNFTFSASPTSANR